MLFEHSRVRRRRGRRVWLIYCACLEDLRLSSCLLGSGLRLGALLRRTAYADGSEELYDHSTDPMEYTNLAGKAEYDSVKQRLSKWLPKENVPNAPHDRDYKRDKSKKKAKKS